jgi:hypothetical protein
LFIEKEKIRLLQRLENVEKDINIVDQKLNSLETKKDVVNYPYDPINNITFPYDFNSTYPLYYSLPSKPPSSYTTTPLFYSSYAPVSKPLLSKLPSLKHDDENNRGKTTPLSFSQETDSSYMKILNRSFPHLVNKTMNYLYDDSLEQLVDKIELKFESDNDYQKNDSNTSSNTPVNSEKTNEFLYLNENENIDNFENIGSKIVTPLLPKNCIDISTQTTPDSLKTDFTSDI